MRVSHFILHRVRVRNNPLVIRLPRSSNMTPQNLLILLSDEHNPKVMGCTGHPLSLIHI